MAVSNVTAPSQALASYAAQLQAQATQPRHSPQDAESKAQEQGERSQGSDRVTLSVQFAHGASQTQDLQTNRNNEAERAANMQAVERKQLENPQETRAAASKSVAQAVEAYLQVSLV